MGKKIKFLGIGLILLVIAGSLVVTLAIDTIVGSNIERIGSEMTETRVTVDDVSISLISGEGTITGLQLANPDGFNTENALVVNDLYIKLDLRSLLTNEITVEQVRVTGPTLFVEQKLTENNLRTILQSIEKMADSSEKPHDPSDDPGKTTGTRLVLAHFILTDGSVHLYTGIGGERAERVSMAPVELHDIGREDGTPVVEQVVLQIAEKVVEQALKASLRGGVDQIKDAIEGFFR